MDKTAKNKIQLVALFGESGSGKDSLLRAVVKDNPSRHRIIRATTRPKRETEKENVDYFFMSNKEMIQKIYNGDLIEAAGFKVDDDGKLWYYGTLFSQLKEDCLNIGAYHYSAIEELLLDNRIEVHPIYIQSDPKVRLLRQLNREEEPNCNEICRRFLADVKDYSNLSSFNYYIIENNDYFESAVNRLERILDGIYLDYCNQFSK